MKPVKSMLFVALLVAVLALKTVAGDVQTPGVVAQPSPTPPNGMRTYEPCTSVTDPYCERSEEMLETSDSLFYEALAALLSVY